MSSFYHPFPFSLMHSSRNLSPPLPLPFIPTRESTGELLTAAGEGGGVGEGQVKAETIDNFPSSFPPSSALAKEEPEERRRQMRRESEQEE